MKASFQWHSLFRELTFGRLPSRLIASSLLSLGKADASIAFLSLNRSLRQSSNEFGSALAAPGVELLSTPVTTRPFSSQLEWHSLLQEFFGQASGAGGT
jgi:hypothetical protein